MKSNSNESGGGICYVANVNKVCLLESRMSGLRDYLLLLILPTRQPHEPYRNFKNRYIRLYDLSASCRN